MAKRLVWIAVLFAAVVACKSSKKGDKGDTKIDSGKTVTTAMTTDSVESALRALGVDGAVSTLELNQTTYRAGPLRAGQVHMMRRFILVEGREEKPRVVCVQRSNLNTRWFSQLPQPTLYRVGENADSALFVSKHFFTPLDYLDGRRSMRFASDEVRRPPLALPFTPTGGAAASSDTAFLVSLGSSVNNKKLESVSLVSGQRGWGWRSLGDITTSPIVGGASGDPRLYFVTSRGIATCLDARNYGFGPRDPRWQRQMSAGVAEGHQPFLTDDTEEVVGGLYTVDRRGTLYCFDRITGQVRWSNPTGLVPNAGPLVFDDICVVPMSNGLLAFDKENVVYKIEVIAGPGKGMTKTIRTGTSLSVGSGDADLSIRDAKLASVHLTFRVSGEILNVVASEDSEMRIDGGNIGSRTSVENGSEIQIGNSTLRIHDVGDQPLWKELPYDRVVVRIGGKMVVAKGNTLTTIDAMTGEALSDTVAVKGLRFAPTNTFDATLVLLTGDATLHALYPR